MSGRIVHRGQNERNQKKFYMREKPTLPNVSNPNSLLYNKNEFPSLNELVDRKVSLTKSEPITEVSEKSDNHVILGQNLKYSDKLKLSCQNPQQKSSQPKHEYSSVVNSQVENKSCNRQSSSRTEEYGINRTHGKKNASCNNFEINSSETKLVDSKKSYDSSIQTSKRHLYQPNTVNESSKLAEFKNQSQRQHTHLYNTQNSTFKYSASKNTPAFNANHIASSESSARSRSKEIKCHILLDRSKINKEGEKTITKKKNRKSKVKRQAAFQTGKLNVLTPEIHSKILNQSNSHKSQTLHSILTDINDDEEYPELGKSFVPSSQKENSVKKEISSIESTIGDTEKISDAPTEKQKIVKDLSLCPSDEKTAKKIKSNKAVHINDPITVAFYDMLLAKSSKAKVKDLKDEVAAPSNVGLTKIKFKKAKVKDLKDEVAAPSNVGLTKIKFKKSTGGPHNLLDSSSPAVKRGKERENPRPKKPSQLKKIILMDRKVRREQLLQLKSNQVDEDQDSGELDSGELNNIEKVNICDSDAEESNKILGPTSENSSTEVLVNLESEELNEDSVQLQSDDCDSCELNPDEEVSVLLENQFSNISSDNLYEKAIVSKECDSSASKNDQTIVSKVPPKSICLIENHVNVLESNDSLLQTLSGTMKNLDILEKEKAAKIVLHTRNFREYCNHLISKDIDDAALALLDDLARFQDRMHHKDPVKARMKRRMIYGVKEVKKHIKLKKLKCIIIATDIENVEAEGGLNDILNDIKSLAADHSIPCVFALGRKALGKVCHKPVPVSCIGVFNPEGSETNFKKMVELQDQSKKDYVEILNNLTSKITEEEVETLFRAKKEAPETLHDIRSNILREVFYSSKADSG